MSEYDRPFVSQFDQNASGFRPGEAENIAINEHLRQEQDARLEEFKQAHGEGTELRSTIQQAHNVLSAARAALGQQAYGPNAPMARGTLADLNEIEPLVKRGVLGANDVNAVVRSNLMGDIAGQRNEREAAKDWQAIELGSRNGVFNEQQVAAAADSFAKTHGAVANMVPGYLAYRGNLASPTTPHDYLSLQTKLVAPVTGLTGKSLEAARNDFVMAAHQLSQPGITKQDAAAMQQQFAQLHPEFAKQVGLPAPMTKDQLVQSAGAASLASAQEAAGDVPLVRDEKGNLRVNEGWKVAQQYKLESQDLAHKKWIEQRRTENDYLKSLDPGKEPLDPDELATWRQHKAFFRSESARIANNRMQNPLPSYTEPPTNNPPRDSSSVDATGKPISFTDPSKAEDAFRNGQLPAGKQFIMRGVRCVFDAQGKPSVVR